MRRGCCWSRRRDGGMSSRSEGHFIKCRVLGQLDGYEKSPVINEKLNTCTL